MNTSGISINGHKARHSGKYPSSIIARKLGVPSKLISEHAPSCEWHHSGTGSPRNPVREVSYYDLDEVREWIATEEAQHALAGMKIETSIEKAARESYVIVGATFTWHESNGLNRWHRMIEHERENVLIECNGSSMATIHFQSGGTMRKNLTGNWVTVTGGRKLTGTEAKKSAAAWRAARTRRKNRVAAEAAQKAAERLAEETQKAADRLAEKAEAIAKLIPTVEVAEWLANGAQHPCPSSVLLAKRASGLTWDEFIIANTK